VRWTAILDEIAERVRAVPSLAGRSYEWTPGSITPPAAMVGLPGPGTYDVTYGRGTDRSAGSLMVFLGRPSDRSTRDLFLAYIDGDGDESVKAAVDGDDYTACDSVTVTGWDVDIVNIGGTDYLTAVFDLDIIGRGTE